jgi:predicted nucleic acid-binding protein
LIVISDSSSLIAISAVGHLDVLRGLYREVIVPPAVWSEVTGLNRPGAADIQTASWIRVESVANRASISTLPRPVGPGEAEAIVLAQELAADILLIDERKARKTALQLGLPVTGVLGVLLEAKKAGLVPAIKPILDQMEVVVAFRLKRSLYDAALQAAGE